MGTTVSGLMARVPNPLPWARDVYAQRSRRRRFERMLWRRQFVAIALARAAATSSLRDLDPTDPLSWSFSGFSQNKEDGIIDYLASRLRRPNRYFIEIGAADGLECNTAWLAVAKRWSGLMVEGDPNASAWCQRMISGDGGLNIGVESACLWVTRENAPEIVRRCVHPDPDVFSIDIDGNDYYVLAALLEAGLRPKICVVEYNSAFGPTRCLTVEYDAERRIDFDDIAGSLYYGVSIAGWRHFFETHGYEFVTVEESGVNACFIDRAEFDDTFVSSLRGRQFEENAWQMMRLGCGWEHQLEMIERSRLVQLDIEPARH